MTQFFENGHFFFLNVEDKKELTNFLRELKPHYNCHYHANLSTKVTAIVCDNERMTTILNYILIICQGKLGRFVSKLSDIPVPELEQILIEDKDDDAKKLQNLIKGCNIQVDVELFIKCTLGGIPFLSVKRFIETAKQALAQAQAKQNRKRSFSETFPASEEATNPDKLIEDEENDETSSQIKPNLAPISTKTQKKLEGKRILISTKPLSILKNLALNNPSRNVLEILEEKKAKITTPIGTSPSSSASFKTFNSFSPGSAFSPSRTPPATPIASPSRFLASPSRFSFSNPASPASPLKSPGTSGLGNVLDLTTTNEISHFGSRLPSNSNKGKEFEIAEDWFCQLCGKCCSNMNAHSQSELHISFLKLNQMRMEEMHKKFEKKWMNSKKKSEIDKNKVDL